MLSSYVVFASDENSHECCLHIGTGKSRTLKIVVFHVIRPIGSMVERPPPTHAVVAEGCGFESHVGYVPLCPHRGDLTLTYS